MSNVLHIKIVGADEGKGPVLLLQLLYDIIEYYPQKISEAEPKKYGGK